MPWTVVCQASLSMGIFQARILEWITISFSKRIFLTKELNLHLLQVSALQEDSLLLSHHLHGKFHFLVSKF